MARLAVVASEVPAVSLLFSEALEVDAVEVTVLFTPVVVTVPFTPPTLVLVDVLVLVVFEELPSLVEVGSVQFAVKKT